MQRSIVPILVRLKDDRKMSVVVQNVPFSPPRTDLEKDVSPSVLSSGGALGFRAGASHLSSDKSLCGALPVLNRMLHQ